MKKGALIAELRQYLKRSPTAVEWKDRGPEWPGQEAFAVFFAGWLERLDIAHYEKFDEWSIEDHLPQLVVDAFEDLRTGQDGYAEHGRRWYKAQTGRAVPDITALGASGISDQYHAVQVTGYMLAKVLGQHTPPSPIEIALRAYCHAEHHAVQIAFDRFVRRVYRGGLYDLIHASEWRGMSGDFGSTSLRTYGMAGRLAISFVRRVKGSTTYRDAAGQEIEKVPYRELSVTFGLETGDPTALRAGLTSAHADLPQAVAMIEEVIAHWPEEKKEQGSAFRPDKEIFPA